MKTKIQPVMTDRQLRQLAAKAIRDIDAMQKRVMPLAVDLVKLAAVRANRTGSPELDPGGKADALFRLVGDLGRVLDEMRAYAAGDR